ncbi:MAG: hypothetical protein NXI00_02970 [Cytophagales bacterium]|nr:hypothetical protein [Cytophagales bacterium]
MHLILTNMLPGLDFCDNGIVNSLVELASELNIYPDSLEERRQIKPQDAQGLYLFNAIRILID